MAKLPCKFFASGKCRFDKACRFSHDAQGAKPDIQPTHDHAASGEDRYERFKIWRFNIPKDDKTVRKARPLGSTALAKFLRDAVEIIDFGSESMQVVVPALATEGGLFRINELLSQDLDGFDDETLEKVWSAQVLPYLRILSHETVVVSAVVAREYAILLNYLYGLSGDVAVKVFRSAVRCLSDGSATNQDHVEICITALACVLEKIGSAQVNTELQAVAQAMIALAESPCSRSIERSLRSIRTALRLGTALPTRQVPAKPSKAAAAKFTVAQDLPGHLSEDGPRHDNDSDDIATIRILPTIAEIQSSRLEYLPRDDSSEWQIPGIGGLLDRHFRLVRENTVGQLRDAAKFELERLQNPGSFVPTARQGARTHVYGNVQLHDVFFDRLKGLLFVLSFDQPCVLQNKTAQQRREWWQDSNRLTPDSLVCLLSSMGEATWLVVHTPNMQQNSKETKPIQDQYSLSKDQHHGYVVAQLTSSDDLAISEFLKGCTSREENLQRSLVEFPVVLLPSFQPTLSALQQMTTDLDIPFADILDPGNTTVNVPPPAYSLRNNFSFDLQALRPGDTVPPATATGDRDADILAALERSSLDEAQRAAVQHTLNHSISLIQGPPGTGKSYTGVKLIRALLDNKTAGRLGPLICVCYTNHALDQLLEHVLDAGVEQVIRIGSRSKSERLATVNLRSVAQNYDATKTEKRQRWEAWTAIEKTGERITEALARLRNILHNAEREIAEYLGSNFPSMHFQIFGHADEDEDGYKLVRPRGALSPLQAWLQQGPMQHTTRDRALQTLQLHNIGLQTLSRGERKILYESWIESVSSAIYQELEMQFESYLEEKEKLDGIRGEIDLRVLSSANVIGVTTSGLARNLNVVRKLPSKILMVEEAAEVLEAHLLTAMLPSLEQLILIGDHQQLRPKVQNYELSVDNPRSQFALDMSLFERLIKPRAHDTTGVPFVTLETQRRMHPSISSLIRSTLYPKLQDAPCVQVYPEVAGMRSRLFWLDHDHREDGQGGESHGTSHTNSFEVDMVAALVRHLVRQGVYTASDIAVLAPYLGQVRKLRSKLSSSFEILLNDRDVDDLIREGPEEQDDNGHPATTPRPPLVKGNLLQALRLATVDNFQGEEAKVVIISLVRSNEQKRCGFLRTPNRINVLLSRAQHGMYIIGNASTSVLIPRWNKVLELLELNGSFGTRFELHCPRHPEKPLQVMEPKEFAIVAPEAGCSELCGKQLPCGHACPSMCHADGLHNAVYCHKDCNRPKEGCEHPCKLPCGEPCERKCKTLVEGVDVQLSCGHYLTSLECWQYQNKKDIRCEEPLERVVPGCGHVVVVHCCFSMSEPPYRCKEPCGTELDCGHRCTKPCCAYREQAIGTVTATDHGSCEKVCGRNYTLCEHSCQQACHPESDCPPCPAKCTSFCIHSSCSKLCHEPCVPCAEPTCNSRCPHGECMMPCSAPCDWVPCSKRCDKKLDCGHQCPSLCGEICPAPTYCQLCAHEKVKELRADLYTFEAYREVDLDATPCIVLPCGHIFTVESLDGHMEMSLHYKLDESGAPISLAGNAEPFSIDKMRGCPDCRASLRSVARYGRIVRRALLDSSTKKFIAWSINLSDQLTQRLANEQGTLIEIASVLKLPSSIKLGGNSSISNTLKSIGSRYKSIIRLRGDISEFLRRARKQEQPYQRVRDLVIAVRRRQQPEASLPDFEFDQTVLQTRGELLARALLLRCELTISTDVVSAWEKTSASIRAETSLQVDFSKNREQCAELTEMAEKSMNILQQAEGHIFWAHLAALQCSAAANSTGPVNSTDDIEALKRTAHKHLDQAQEIVEQYPGQTASVKDEIAGVGQMISDSISKNEIRMVVAAMAKEFSGTGHWYYCANGHPFTVGECGMPMEATRCPQCNAPIGGQNHQPAAGVSRAADIESDFGNLHL